MKNFLVVGHSSGIGKAVASSLAKENNVYGTFYTKNQSNSNTTNISSHYLNVLSNDIDLSFLPDKLDGIVYCPGAINLKPILRIKEEELINDFKLQVTGAIKVIQACLPKLKNAESTSIVLYSTVAVKVGFNFHTIVSASKGAIEGITKSLSAELAPKIRVNCIAPSITNTPLAEHLLNTPDKLTNNINRHPLKKIGAADDIASMTIFLLSDNAQWITGQVFNIDGGLSAIK